MPFLASRSEIGSQIGQKHTCQLRNSSMYEGSAKRTASNKPFAASSFRLRVQVQQSSRFCFGEPSRRRRRRRRRRNKRPRPNLFSPLSVSLSLSLLWPLGERGESVLKDSSSSNGRSRRQNPFGPSKPDEIVEKGGKARHITE